MKVIYRLNRKDAEAPRATRLSMVGLKLNRALKPWVKKRRPIKRIGIASSICSIAAFTGCVSIFTILGRGSPLISIGPMAT